MLTRRQLLASAASAPAVLSQGARRRNIIFILSDDHRFDMIGALGHPWLKTPHLDRLLGSGVHFRNAFVTSSLCSPSRASILTGLYMHAHGVKDNFSPLAAKHATFPQLLQKAGYRTGFIGKWHMGGASDEARPGFDHWFSFRGQGEYFDPTVNVNGDRRKMTGYLSDLQTEDAVRFIRSNRERPFCLYLSHKAVHFPFQPAPRHQSLYERDRIPWPKSMTYFEEQYAQWPEWVKRRRYTRHGVDGAFGNTIALEDAYRGYCRALMSVDDSVGQVMNALEEAGLAEDTLVVYMGDNGFMWGEHGLVDKRAMYEPSIRVPLIMRCPALFGSRRTVDEMTLNIDLAPTFLDAAGVKPPAAMHGRSLLPLFRAAKPEWRNEFLYNYEWEQDYPMTPTIVGLRTERWALMNYWGVWDVNELYDLQTDPDQMKNLLKDARVVLNRGRMFHHIKDPALKEQVRGLQARLSKLLESTGGDPRLSGLVGEGDEAAF